MYCKRVGFRVPEDVSITGFNDTPLSKVVTPPLTTVPWRMYERGQQAARLLLGMLVGESGPCPSAASDASGRTPVMRLF